MFFGNRDTSLSGFLTHIYYGKMLQGLFNTRCSASKWRVKGTWERDRQKGRRKCLCVRHVWAERVTVVTGFGCAFNICVIAGRKILSGKTLCVWTEMINRSVQEGRARVNSKKLKKWGRSGRKERRSECAFCPGMICVKHWSGSDTFPYCSAVISGWTTICFRNPGLNLCERVDHMCFMDDWLAGDWLHVRIGNRYNHVMLFGKSKLEWHSGIIQIHLCNTLFSVTHSCITLLQSLAFTLLRFRWSAHFHGKTVEF